MERIAVTVIEQVSPDAVSFVLRNLVRDEEEPGDFDASLGGVRFGSEVMKVARLVSFKTKALSLPAFNQTIRSTY